VGPFIQQQDGHRRLRIGLVAAEGLERMEGGRRIEVVGGKPARGQKGTVKSFGISDEDEVREIGYLVRSLGAGPERKCMDEALKLLAGLGVSGRGQHGRRIGL
jgi:hypothetical protein